MTPPAYLLAGEEFLIDEALDEIRAQVGGTALSEMVFEAGHDVSDIIGALTTSSLLGGPRLVVILRGHELKKADADAIAGYLDDPSPGSVLVVAASGRTKLDAAIKKIGSVTTLDAPKGRRLVAWLRRQAQSLDLALEDRAAWSLVDSVGTELRDLDAALKQLLSAHGSGARITGREVGAMFHRSADERIYAFTDAVGERRLGPAMTALRRLLLQGEPHLVLFGSLTAQVRRMLTARRHAERGAGAVADVLNLPSWRAERLQRQALSYREDELVRAMSLLAEVDVQMKSGDYGDSPEVPLERVVIEIVTGARAASTSR